MIPDFTPLDNSFFHNNTIAVAVGLVGRVLARIHPDTGDIITAGRIVETEAYLHKDPASHSFGGETPRNRAMFLPAGHVYVYRIYGIHRCVNIVTNVEGCGEAVLLRALEPLTDLDGMWSRRYRSPMPAVPDRKHVQGLCSGPGKLTIAMDIEVEGFDGSFLGAGPLGILNGVPVEEDNITTGRRIGLAAGRGDELPLRFCLSGSTYLSRKAGNQSRR